MEHDLACAVDMTSAVALFRSLGDPTRLAIVHELARGEARSSTSAPVTGPGSVDGERPPGLLADCGFGHESAGRDESFRPGLDPELFAL